MTTNERRAADEVMLRRARVERRLELLRASLWRESGGSWKGRSWGLLLTAGAVGVALGTSVFRRRRRGLYEAGD